jgi:ABC-type multidrug transport system fused ATPase/permease subunit
MQLASRAPAAPKQRRMGKPNMASLGRSLRYLARYPRLTLGATLALIIATAAQLVVPQLVQRIIDTIVANATNQGISVATGQRPDHRR